MTDEDYAEIVTALRLMYLPAKAQHLVGELASVRAERQSHVGVFITPHCTHQIIESGWCQKCGMRP